MGGIQRKLRSRKGASISYALLLFLVCAAAGSVVLAAAAAAAGRLSGLAEADQRYYSVTSAAELLKEKYDGAGVKAVKTETKEVITTYSFEGGETGSTETPGIPTFTIDGEEAGEDYVPKSLLQAAASYLLTADGLTVFPAHREFTLEASGISQEKADRLLVNGKAKLMRDGTITLEISSRTEAGRGSEAGVYMLLLTFGADRQDRTSSRTRSGTPETDGEGGYQVTSLTTETTTMDITWRLTEIRTVTGG